MKAVKAWQEYLRLTYLKLVEANRALIYCPFMLFFR
jgi:hypothetical protein